MENFIVSARKYRPATFDTVVGQRSITTTLKNAIKSKQLAHAYLFCGPRGVGKTTCARIFAKTINCQNLTDELEACNECESCKAFNSSRSYNIHELDAASNNSVEDIRQLIEKVRIPPQIGKHSVYIVDEVHMLSTQAFNAFLKTLEEPPPHAKFILATTEKHKIIPTILSRCQIFDFNRIQAEDIVEHLTLLSEKEGVEADLDGLNVIAQKADGGMRDALSFFDQIVSFSGKQITYQKVIDNLNVLDYEFYFRLVDSFLNADVSESLLIFNEILDKGFDAHHFISGLSQHIRDILVCKDEKTIQLLEVGASIRERYKEQAKACSIAFLYKALNISNACDLSYRESKNKRLLVELAILQMCNISNSLTPVQELTNESEKKNETASEQKKEPVNYSQTQKKQTVASSTISLKDAIAKKSNQNQQAEQKEETENKEETDLSELNETVDQKKLETVWSLLLKKYEGKKPRLFSMLNANKPSLKSETIIDFILSNQLQKESLESVKSEILNFLRQELRNGKLDLNFVISDEKPKDKLFTDKDKYEYLSNKNKNLNSLKQQLNLDF